MSLNRGYRFGKKGNENDTGIKSPEFYIFPVDVVKKGKYEKSKWGKIRITKIPDYLLYKENWNLIKSYLDNL